MRNKRLLDRFMTLAGRIAKKSDHPDYRLSCILFSKGRVISIGYNQLKTHPRSPHEFKSVHAELHCILGVDMASLRGSDIFVYRENSTGLVGIAKPCNSCKKLLEDVGIRNVYYTTKEGYGHYKNF